MAAGVELEAASVDAFRGALAAHAGAALSPDDLIPVERVDAVVPGGELGLELAEQLDLLRPFGMGNPQPTLLVPAARIANVAGMGEERQHARFTLVSAGIRARGVAFGATQKSLTADDARHVAVRLESNRWNGAVEPRVVLRALCSPEPGSLRELGEGRPFWECVRAAFERDPAAAPQPVASGSITDRRGAGFAGVAGDLLSSGESVLVTVADVPRRRASLEALVAGMAEGDLVVVSWSTLEADAQAAAGFGHLLALDPPPGGIADPLLRLAPSGHAAWGPDEAAFALAVWRAGLELRPALTEGFRALRAAARDASASELETALAGRGAYPRTPACCGRVLRVLVELGLVDVDFGGPSCAVVEGVRSDLELSPAFRAYRARFERIERALAGELPAAPQAAPVARAS
jgi:single-stranded-DNA-specific exonuclease